MTRLGLASVVVALVLGSAAACGGDEGDELAPGVDGGGSAMDGGPVPTGTEDGGPTTTGDDGGSGPSLLDVDCPALEMPAAGATTVYVDGSMTGAEDGTKAAPYQSVAKAFQSAPKGSVLWVARGIYRENLTIPDKDLSVVGGFASGFASRADACATILEAFDVAKPVLSASATVKRFGIEGLTVQKGARGLEVSGDSTVGASFTLARSVFTGNGRPEAVGGGAYLDRVNATITGSVFRDNRAAKGAAVASNGETADLVIDGCRFEKNLGHSDHGGALYLSPRTGKVTRNTVRGNEIGKTAGYGWGGGMIVFKAGQTPVKVDLAFNVFTDNLASVGGAVFVDDGANVTMSHDLVFRNRAYPQNGLARGGAVYVDGLGPSTGSTFAADHVTFVDNARDVSGAAVQGRGGAVYMENGSKATITNAILWKNGDEALFGDATTAFTVHHAVAPSSCAGGASCAIGAGVFLPADVLFADEAAADWHERSITGRFAKGAWVKDPASSPAIDAADPASPFAGEPAPNGGRANLGVYGGTAEASKSP